MRSLLASWIRRHLLASPYSRLAIFERLSPFTTTYVLPEPLVATGSGAARAVDDPPDCTLLKSGFAADGVSPFLPKMSSKMPMSSPLLCLLLLSKRALAPRQLNR